jgi:putative transposase
VSVPVLAVVGVLPDGHKHLLVLELCGGESFEAWKGCLDDLAARGLRTPMLCIIDGNAGLRRAVALVWPGAAVQRCWVHKLRNLERKAPKHALADIRDHFHRIVYAASGEAARTAFTTFERTWAKRCPGVVASLREGSDELLTFFRFPKAQWKTLRTTNTIAATRGIPAPREDARLAPKRRRRAGLTLQPRGERPDQVAQDRRLAQNRRTAQPAHVGGAR